MKCCQLKVVCSRCGYLVRIARKWISVGLPTCPCGHVMEEGRLKPLPTCPKKHSCYVAQQCQAKCGVIHELRTPDDGFVAPPMEKAE